MAAADLVSVVDSGETSFGDHSAAGLRSAAVRRTFGGGPSSGGYSAAGLRSADVAFNRTR